MQTRHLEKGTDSNHIAPGLLALLPISQLKCLALPGDTQVGEESSLLSCQVGRPAREFKSLSLGHMNVFSYREMITCALSKW